MPSPPPRKVKPTVWLKEVHSKQLAILNQREQSLLDLLEDIRSFSKQRADIERLYAQSLLKLTSQYLGKKDATDSYDSEKGEQSISEFRTAHEVWRKCLGENEKVAQIRLNAADTYANQVSEKCRHLRLYKQQVVKKAMDHLQTLQAECQQTVKEMSVNHKQYTEEEAAACEARNKAQDAEKRLNQKETGLFSSVSTLKKSSAKTYARSIECTARATSSRNGYLLELAAVNAHTFRMHQSDMPAIFKVLDENLFEALSQHITLIGQTEVNSCNSILSSHSDIMSEAKLIDPKYNLDSFIQSHDVFSEQTVFKFDPVQNDPIQSLSLEYDEKSRLEKETRNWARKMTKESKSVAMLQDQLSRAGSSSLSSGNKSGSPVETPDSEYLQAQTNLRKVEIAKSKAEARLNLLRTASMPVDEMISQASIEPDAVDAQSIASHESQPSLHSFESTSDSPRHDTVPLRDRNMLTPKTVQARASTFLSAEVLYDYVACQEDELSLTAGETLHIDNHGAGDGWVKATNWKGEQGMVPENYIDQYEDKSYLEETAEQDQTIDQNQTVDQDPTVDQDQTVAAQAAHDPPQPEDVPSAPIVQAPPPDPPQLPTVLESLPIMGYCRALYDYEGEDDEISFSAGQVIALLSRDENGIDDGYWKGEVNGRQGMFPAIVVEEIADDTPTREPTSTDPSIDSCQPHVQTLVEEEIEMRYRSAPPLPSIQDADEPLDSAQVGDNNENDYPYRNISSLKAAAPKQPVQQPVNKAPVAAKRTSQEPPTVHRETKPMNNEIARQSTPPSSIGKPILPPNKPSIPSNKPSLPPNKPRLANRPTTLQPESHLPPWERGRTPPRTDASSKTESESQSDFNIPQARKELYTAQPSMDVWRTGSGTSDRSHSNENLYAERPSPDLRRTNLQNHGSTGPANAYSPYRPQSGPEPSRTRNYVDTGDDIDQRRFRNMTAIPHQFYMDQARPERTAGRIEARDRSSSGRSYHSQSSNESLDRSEKHVPIRAPARQALDRLQSASTPEGHQDIVTPLSLKDAMRNMPRGLVNPSYRVAIGMDGPSPQQRAPLRKPSTPSRVGGLPGHVRDGITQGRKALNEAAKSPVSIPVRNMTRNNSKSETSV